MEDEGVLKAEFFAELTGTGRRKGDGNDSWIHNRSI